MNVLQFHATTGLYGTCLGSGRHIGPDYLRAVSQIIHRDIPCLSQVFFNRQRIVGIWKQSEYSL